MQQDIILPTRLSVVDPVVTESVTLLVVGPAHGTHPIERLSPDQKTQALVDAVLRARYELRAERRRWRHLKLRTIL